MHTMSAICVKSSGCEGRCAGGLKHTMRSQAKAPDTEAQSVPPLQVPAWAEAGPGLVLLADRDVDILK